MGEKMIHALIDADSIYFRAAYVAKKENEIRKIIDKTMREIESQVAGVGFDDVQLRTAVKGKGNFRKDYWPFYKDHRKELDEEMKKALNFGHTYMMDKWDGVMADGMEADDLVSIWAYEARDMEEQYEVVGIDKDLLQIPGNHYRFVKPKNGDQHVFVDDNTAHHNLMVQCLTGDNADNIPGIKGIGPVKAKKILGDIPAYKRWSRVQAAWRGYKAGDPRVSYRLLSMIKTWEEFDGIKAECETLIGKQNVLPKQEQDSRVS